MIDVPACRKLDGLAPRVRLNLSAAVAELLHQGNPVLVFETTRTRDRVAFLYGKGRTEEQLKAVGIDIKFAQPTEKIVTKASAWPKSWHSHGLAVDLIHPKLYWGAPRAWFEKVAEVMVDHGFDWGGNWPTLPDVPHFQHHGCPIGPRAADQQNLLASNVHLTWAKYGAI